MNARPIYLVAAICALALPTWAQTSVHQGPIAQGLILPTLHTSSDSDDMRITKIGGGLLYRYTHAQHYTGLVWEHQRFSQTGKAALNGQNLSWITQHIDPATALGYQLKAGYSPRPTRSLFTFDGSLAYALSPSTRVEWFASRDRVDSMDALQNGTHYTLAGSALDYTLHPRLTAVASLAHTQFSDSTHRNQLRLRLIWDAIPQHGITLQLLHKNQWGDESSTGYFNPDRLLEHMAAIGWRHRINGWLVAARVSAGQQKVNQASWEPARLSELQLTSPPSPNGQLKLRLGEQKNWDVSGPNYRYRSLDLQWVMPL
jgi:hypothetical protein